MEAGAEAALRLTEATLPATLVALLTHCAEAAEADEEFVAVRASPACPGEGQQPGYARAEPLLPSSLFPRDSLTSLVVCLRQGLGNAGGHTRLLELLEGSDEDTVVNAAGVAVEAYVHSLQLSSSRRRPFAAASVYGRGSRGGVCADESHNSLRLCPVPGPSFS